MKTILAATLLVLGMVGAAFAAETETETGKASAPVKAAQIKEIKAYCLDFNWGARRRFATPGSWRNAEPAKEAQEEC